MPTSAVDHLLHTGVSIDFNKRNIRMLLSEDSEYLICKSLPDSFNTLEVEHNRLEPIKPRKQPLGLRS